MATHQTTLADFHTGIRLHVDAVRKRELRERFLADARKVFPDGVVISISRPGTPLRDANGELAQLEFYDARRKFHCMNASYLRMVQLAVLGRTVLVVKNTDDELWTVPYFYRKHADDGEFPPEGRDGGWVN